MHPLVVSGTSLSSAQFQHPNRGALAHPPKALERDSAAPTAAWGWGCLQSAHTRTLTQRREWLSRSDHGDTWPRCFHSRNRTGGGTPLSVPSHEQDHGGVWYSATPSGISPLWPHSKYSPPRPRHGQPWSHTLSGLHVLSTTISPLPVLHGPVPALPPLLSHPCLPWVPRQPGPYSRPLWGLTSGFHHLLAWAPRPFLALGAFLGLWAVNHPWPPPTRCSQPTSSVPSTSLLGLCLTEAPGCELLLSNEGGDSGFPGSIPMWRTEPALPIHVLRGWLATATITSHQ